MAFLIFSMVWSCELLLLFDLLDLLLRKLALGLLVGASNWMVATCRVAGGAVMTAGDVNLGRPPCDVILVKRAAC